MRKNKYPESIAMCNKSVSSAVSVIRSVAVTGLLSFVASDAKALPFNQDMVGRQLTSGQIMRSMPEGSVSRGSENRYIASPEEALGLVNPVPPTKASVNNGQRLYSANCSPCHGRFIDDKYVMGALATQMPGRDLRSEDIKAKPDGHFFRFIYFGGMAIMPKYGWKFSFNEHWDIVNYIRSIQNRVLAGDQPSQLQKTAE